jgi:hypothetical protein
VFIPFLPSRTPGRTERHSLLLGWDHFLVCSRAPGGSEHHCLLSRTHSGWSRLQTSLVSSSRFLVSCAVLPLACAFLPLLPVFSGRLLVLLQGAVCRNAVMPHMVAAGLP